VKLVTKEKTWDALQHQELIDTHIEDARFGKANNSAPQSL